MKQKTRRRLQNIGVLLLLLCGVAWIVCKFTDFTSTTYTDNAQVERRIVPVYSRVRGYVERVCFNDFQRVHRGDTLAIIDATEYELGVQRADAELRNALAGRSVSASAVATIGSNSSADAAAIAETRALLDNAERELKRYAALLEQRAVTQQQYDNVLANRDALAARLKGLQSRSNTTGLSVNEQRTRVSRDEAGIDIARSALDMAKLQLSYTVITAPCDGWCQRRDIEPGQLVEPGRLIVDIVDAENVWVVANYREKQTADMAPGDTIDFTVDAVPGVKYVGVVSELARATGARTTGRSAENAVGNFVKVEQRIPVKIVPVANTATDDLERLRAGMNVQCKARK